MTEVKEREVAIVPPKDHTPVVRSLDPSDFPTPTSRDEEFRFTPMSRLHNLHQGNVVATGSMAIAVNKVPGSSFEIFFSASSFNLICALANSAASSACLCASLHL